MTEQATITIRPVRESDAADLATVYESSAEHHVRLDPSLYAPPDYDKLVERYRARLPLGEDAAIFVADSGGEVVGWVEIQLRRPSGEPRMLRDALSADIDLAVLPEFRDRGIGTSLLQEAERWSTERGATLLTLEVHAANVDAIRFYQERHGWRTTGLLLMKRPGPAPG